MGVEIQGIALAVEAMKASGLVGEERAIRLVYLAVTSRRLSRIVSLVVKGPSSAGKSFLVQQVLTLFPPEATQVFFIEGIEVHWRSF